jgi:2-dehydropantoate 2-reductase
MLLIKKDKRYEMKIAIIGAGGVGSYLGAKLLKASNDVSLLARGAHLKAIQAEGLHVIDEGIKFHVSSRYFYSSFDSSMRFDLVIFTTKTFDLEEACNIIQPNTHQSTILMSISNGVGHKETLKKHFPNLLVCEACIYILSNLIQPGVIKKYGGVFQLFIGSDEVPPKKLEELYHLFNQANLKTKVSTKISLECWRKYLFISSFAIMTTFYNESMGEIVKNHEEELRKVLEEIIKLANKKGISLEQRNLEQVIYRAKTSLPYNSKTSMQLDFEQNKQSELYALCGYLIDESEKLGLELPTIQSLYKWLLIKANQTA